MPFAKPESTTPKTTKPRKPRQRERPEGAYGFSQYLNREPEQSVQVTSVAPTKPVETQGFQGVLNSYPETPKPVIPPSTPSQPLQPMVSRTDYGALAKQVKEKEVEDYLTKEKERINNSKAPGFIKAYANFVDEQLAHNPVGKFVNRISNMVGNVQGIDTQAANAVPVQSTGNKFADKTADILGGAAGLLVDPVPVQGALLEPGTMAAAKNIAGKVSRGFSSMLDNGKTKAPRNLFGEQNIGITPAGMSKSSRMVSTEQQIVSNPLKQSVRGAADTAKQTAKAAYQNAVDYVAPLKKISRRTYNTAIDASRANNLANTIIRDKFVDNQGQVIGKSLDEIMKNSRGLGKTVDDYLVLRHAPDRMRRGENVYDPALKMTPEKAEARVKMLEKRYPQLAQIGKDWDEFNTNLLDSGVKEGLISQASRDAMREKNPHYASMRRQFSAGEKLAQPKFGNGGSAFSGQKAPIKEVSPTGSTRKIVSPIRSAIEQVQAWKNAELRNRTMQEIVRAIQRDPNGMKGIAEIVKKPSTSYKSLDDALREGGSEEFLEQLDNDFKSLFKQHNPGAENIVRAMVKGNPVYIKVADPEAVKALLGMGGESTGFIMGAMQKLSNATKRGATGVLAPMFAVKNLTADTVQAAIQSPNAIKHLTIDLPHALISSLGEAFKIPGLRTLADEFRRAGGEYSSLLRGDRQLNRSVSSLRREAPLSTRGIAKGAVTAVKFPFKLAEKFGDITENANRMAAFRRDILGKERTPANVRSAINAARESTTNFSRRGAFGREAEAFVPYSNAAIQGMYRLSKALIKHPVKTLTGIGTLVIAPKLIEFARFNDDPDYQNLPARERYRNMIIGKNADGTFRKIPMAPEYNAFGALFTDILDRVYNKDPQAFKGSLDALANAYTPPFMTGALQGITQGGGLEQSIKGAINSTVAAPFVAIAGNQSFTGSPIVPMRLQDRSAKYQYDERTSGVAKKIGMLTGWSPMKVDYLVRAYGGDPSRLLLPLTSDAGAGTPRNTLLRNFIADPVFTNTLADDYYSAKDRLSQARNDNKDVGAELPKWYSDEAYDLINSQKKGSASKRLSELNAQKREINGNKLLPAHAKAQQLRSIQAQINEIYLDVNTQLQRMGVPFKGR